MLIDILAIGGAAYLVGRWLAEKRRPNGPLKQSAIRAIIIGSAVLALLVGMALGSIGATGIDGGRTGGLWMAITGAAMWSGSNRSGGRKRPG